MYAFRTCGRSIVKLACSPVLIKPPIRLQSAAFLQSRFLTTAETADSETAPYKRRESHNVDLEEEYKKEIADILQQYVDKKKRRQGKIGVVVSTRAAKSISVEVRRMKYYPKYRGFIPRHRKIMAHDETQRAREGDIVCIVPCRPRSRRKRHELIDIIRRPMSADGIEVPLPETQK